MNDDGAYIVTASDTMVSGGIVAMDGSTIKAEPFHKDWTAMISGDLTQCVPIIDKAKEYFAGRKNTLPVARSVFKEPSSATLSRCGRTASWELTA